MGISTVLITVSPEESEQAGPPRALRPKPFPIGQSLGRPGEAPLQSRVLADALELLKYPGEPGTLVERDYVLDA